MMHGLRQVIYALSVVMIGLVISATALPPKNKVVTLRFRGGKATAKGFVGGENIDTYVFLAKKGQTASVQFKTTDVKPNFTISGPGKDPQVDFGKKGDDGLSWEGEIPKTGRYSIDVTSNPDPSNYTLTVVLRQPKKTGHR
jgi:hypothetical protein